MENTDPRPHSFHVPYKFIDHLITIKNILKDIDHSDYREVEDLDRKRKTIFLTFKDAPAKDLFHKKMEEVRIGYKSGKDEDD
jgi:hypothetical protein